MYVLMNMHGFPISSTASIDCPELQDRFWFWQGTSGKKYIHTIYTPGHCPPVPGAVYVGVKRLGHLRVALMVGRFGTAFDGLLPEQDASDLRTCDEIHVHLLARGAEAAETVWHDLDLAMTELPEETSHQGEATRLPLAA
jgi:hypothetical protein